MTSKTTPIVFKAAFLFAALMPIIGTAQSDAPKPVNTLTRVDAGVVDRIDVMLINEQPNFFSAVSQNFIERNYDIKYSVRMEYAHTLLSLVNEQIAKAKETTSRRNYDFRYAVIIYDDKIIDCFLCPSMI